MLLLIIMLYIFYYYYIHKYITLWNNIYIYTGFKIFWSDTNTPTFL